MEIENIELEIKEKESQPVDCGFIGDNYEVGDLDVSAALMVAQANYAPLLKDTDNPFFKSKYATLDGVIAATRSALRDQGLVVIQKNLRRNNEIGVLTRLIHIPSGEELVDELYAPPEKMTSQGIGSVITYLRRYGMLTITGAAPEDDDGAAASGTTQPRSTYEQKPRAATTVTPSVAVHSQTPLKPPTPPITASPQGFKEPIIQPSIQELPVKAVIPPFSTTSETLAGFPAPDKYKAYTDNLLEIIKTLEKNGLTGRTADNKLKIKKYAYKVYKVNDLKELTIAQWDGLLTEFVGLLSTPEGMQKAIELVEKANKV